MLVTRSLSSPYFLLILSLQYCAAAPQDYCRFAPRFSCGDFLSDPLSVDTYTKSVMLVEGQFAQPGVAYDSVSGYTYDGHPLDYDTGRLYGAPHLFSAPSKESIHLGVLALAISGDQNALLFSSGWDSTIAVLELKLQGYAAFNSTYPGYGCFFPWVGFDADHGTIEILDSWKYRVPGLDNGEMFWSLYAVTVALEGIGKYPDLASGYRSYMQCQRDSAKMIFYRGDGDVSAVATVVDPFLAPTAKNYAHYEGYLNDPYEGETMTQLLFLFSDWESAEEREMLWEKKRDMFVAVNYTIPSDVAPKGVSPVVTVQNGWWFSTHEQWKLLLLPYISSDLPLVRSVFENAEKVRTWDAFATKQPGLLASINDVTDGGEEIPSYDGPTGVQEVAHEKIERRDVITPYGSFGLLLLNKTAGLCWYNNMLRGPRMQSRYGSTEAVNVNGTMISPLTTWDSKITSVLALLGGVGGIVAAGLRRVADPMGQYSNAYDLFVATVGREHERVFGASTGFTGDQISIQLPGVAVPHVLSEWENPCGSDN